MQKKGLVFWLFIFQFFILISSFTFATDCEILATKSDWSTPKNCEITQGGDTAVYTRGSNYDYAPSIMYDGGKYKMWWCGYEKPGYPSDHVLYAESTSLNGPWHANNSTTPNSYNITLSPTGNDPKGAEIENGDFDGIYTCDPSVIKVNGIYYLYYGGEDGIGLATSLDGINFVRSQKNPIARPLRTRTAMGNPDDYYGAGQPSVTYANGYFYLIYTDTSGLDSWFYGLGQYAFRSKDPNFKTGVEEFGVNGFAPYSAANHTKKAFFYSVSVDWQYDPLHSLFLVGSKYSGEPTNEMGVAVFDYSLKHMVSMATFPAFSAEGPGIVSTPEKQSIYDTANQDRIIINLFKPVGALDTPFSWDLAYSGINLLLTHFLTPCVDCAVPADYDGDGKTDTAKYNKGNWDINKSITKTIQTSSFGWGGSIAVPADYDGDNKTDLAVYCPFNCDTDPDSTWYVLRTKIGFYKINFGRIGEVPVPGDYDGDGNVDIAIYCSHDCNTDGDSTWYILGSKKGLYKTTFGWNGVTPIPADYDGDGNTDIAVYYPPEGKWYIKGMNNNQPISFGPVNTIPVPADYDGDGKANLATYLPDGGKWYIEGVNNNQPTPWGWSEAIPVPSDYDGDGNTDIAVYYEPQEKWYINYSSPNIAGCNTSNWTYSDGACQSNNKKTRTWNKSGTCSGGITHLNTEQFTCAYVPKNPVCNDFPGTTVSSPQLDTYKIQWEQNQLGLNDFMNKIRIWKYC